MDLKQIRQKGGITQEQMAQKLKVSRPTYIQIERGEKELTVSQACLIGELCKCEKGKSPNKSPKSHLQFVPQKFKEVLLYVLEKVGAKPNIGETALFKLLYFIDFDFYEKYNQFLTGATYMKNHHGPTPKQFKPITDEMIQDGELEAVKSKYFQYDQKKYLPHRKANLNIFTAIEKEHIDNVLSRLSDKNGSELRGYSHEDVPWMATQDQTDIQYDLVFQRTQPYAQIDSENLWISAASNDLLKELGPVSEEEYQYYLNLREQK